MSDEMEFRLTMSPTVGKLFEAMAKAQAEMGHAPKDSQNPHLKNRYASLASCFEAARVLHKHGLAVLQPPVPHGPDGVCVATIVGHASGEWLRGDLYMPASKKDPQGFGSALTYARRYGLCSTIGLATDDDDANAAKTAPAQQAQAAPTVQGAAIDVDALAKQLDEAKDPEQLSIAAVTVSRVREKIAPKDYQRLRDVHDKTLRRLGADA